MEIQTNKNNNFLYFLSYSLINSLYIQGLIAKDELDKIDTKNKTSFIDTWLD